MRLLMIICVVLLQGCAAYKTHNIEEIKRHIVPTVFIPQEQVIHNGVPVSATAEWIENTCVIKMDKNRYTHSCLGHEYRHCLEGHWHGQRAVAC